MSTANSTRTSPRDARARLRLRLASLTTPALVETAEAMSARIDAESADAREARVVRSLALALYEQREGAGAVDSLMDRLGL